MHTQRVGRVELDEAALLRDVERSADFVFSDAYSDYLCGGPWRSCMLWSTGGTRGDGVITNYDHGRPPARTEYAARVPYVTSLIERWFDLEHLNFARLAVISNSVIIPHRDLLELSELPADARNVHRVHVPLVTNERCFFSEGNVVYRMRAGEVWFFDSSRIHSAASFSEEPRIHLMLDFSNVDDVAKLVALAPAGEAGIPEDSVCAREPLTGRERDSLLSLAAVIDEDNYRDVFSIVIRKHYRKDGGEDFVWSTLHEIARRSGNEAVARKIDDMHRYFLIERSA